MELSLHRRAKIAAASASKGLQLWLDDAVREKLEREAEAAFRALEAAATGGQA